MYISERTILHTGERYYRLSDIYKGDGEYVFYSDFLTPRKYKVTKEVVSNAITVQLSNGMLFDSTLNTSYGFYVKGLATRRRLARIARGDVIKMADLKNFACSWEGSTILNLGDYLEGVGNQIIDYSDLSYAFLSGLYLRSGYITDEGICVMSINTHFIKKEHLDKIDFAFKALGVTYFRTGRIISVPNCLLTNALKVMFGGKVEDKYLSDDIVLNAPYLWAEGFAKGITLGRFMNDHVRPSKLVSDISFLCRRANVTCLRISPVNGVMGVNAFNKSITVQSGYEHNKPTDMYLLECLDDNTYTDENEEGTKGLMASGVLLY